MPDPQATPATIAERLSPDLVDVLLHTLGLDRAAEPYRNHFAAESSSDDYRRCEELAAMGLMWKGLATGYGHYFHATETGKAAAAKGVGRGG